MSATTMPDSTPRPTLLRDAIVTFAALMLVLAWDYSGLDLAAARAYGNASGFAWRDAWLTRDVLHDGGRWLAWGVIAALAIDAARPRSNGLTRRARWYWVAMTLACAMLVPAIKRLSLSSCPWELAEFGGLARYVTHWQWGIVDGGPGHCFPSGHAVAAFAFFTVYFAWRESRPQLARLCLLVVCVAGVLFGWAQLARGAHYPSHTLWSAWLCWFACVVAAQLPRLRQRPVMARPAVGDRAGV
ncbi:MAG: phosphatase PAP2 family protein [Burkholderiaceae bacterium]